MFDYTIQVNKLDVQFEAVSSSTKDKTIHRKVLGHVEAPKAIRAIYEKASENQEEVEFLYEATKLFQAKKIEIRGRDD